MENNSKRKLLMFKLSILIISFSLGLIIGEVVLRAVFNPIDYLHPDIMNDPVLGIRIKPWSAGHDSWGYRNRTVPEKVEIVAIGDSQTYGLSATSVNSWPAVLQEITGTSVYNLSLPGYDPVDYYYLMQTEAFRLKPSVIIAGFYFGNDISEAYRNVYSRENWAGLRKPGIVPDKGIQVKSVESVSDEKGKFLGSLRGWLAHHSLLYRITTFYAADMIKYSGKKYRGGDNSVTLFEDASAKIRTSFTPSMRLGAMDIDKPEIKEGIRLCLEVFSMMKKECDQKNIRFLVLLIPTKESVFARHIENNHALKNSATINDLLLKERKVNDLVKTEFRRQGISFIEVLAPLSKAVGEKQIYPLFDGHPNARGYRIIAESAAQFLKQN